MGEKERILAYLDKQLKLKLATLESLDVPIVSDTGKIEIEKEAIKIKHDIYELNRHIEVIKML